MMSCLAALSLLALSAAPGSIEVALAERTGTNTARLTILRSDERLQALCLNLEGWSEDLIEQAHEQVAARPVWLYLGSRKIARGKLLGRFETSASATAPCAVTSEAQFEGFVPYTASNDVLWATTRDLGSKPQPPLPRGVTERARQAVPDRSACSLPSFVVARPVDGGTYVSLSCAARVSLVFVPTKGEPRLVETGPEQDGPAVLLEAVKASRGGRATLFLSREVEGGKRIEAWESDGREARRVDAWIF